MSEFFFFFIVWNIIWFGLVWFGWCGLVWFGWFGLVWFGWFGVVAAGFHSVPESAVAVAQGPLPRLSLSRLPAYMYSTTQFLDSEKVVHSLNTQIFKYSRDMEGSCV